MIRSAMPLSIAQLYHNSMLHYTSMLVVYAMMAYLLIVAGRMRFRWIVVALSAGLVLASDFSRIYLGVHFFSDVVAGYAAATMWLWLSICVSGCEVARGHPRMRQRPET